MSRPSSIPSYRLHKQSGQAIVTVTDGLGGRRDVLLGRYGTPESRQEYARVIAEWEASGRHLINQAGTLADLTVNELLLVYYRFAEGYYRKNGKPTSQLDRVRLALKPVKELYGHTGAKTFGPKALKAVRDVMIRNDWTRGYVNSSIGCIRRAFKWGVENEMVPPSVYHGLLAVPGLKKGRTEARDPQPIRPVDDAHVEATLPFLRPQVQAMVRVQRLTGMRPCEVVIMRPCDIDRSRDRTWIYRPESHKTEHHGIERVVFIGPQAQEILLPFLEGREPAAYLFSPREAMADFRAQIRRTRKTKVQPSQQDRRKRKSSRQPGEHYRVDSYDRAIANACRRAGMPQWAPNQLRHSNRL